MTAQVIKLSERSVIPGEFALNDPFLVSLVGMIREGLARDQVVRLYRFGTFRLKWTKPGTRRHPKTGRLIHYAAQPRVYFSASASLRELIESAQVVTENGNKKDTQKRLLNAVDLRTENAVANNCNPEKKKTGQQSGKRRLGVVAGGMIAAVPLILALLNSQPPVSPETKTAAATRQTETISVAEAATKQPREKLLHLQPQIHIVSNGESLWSLSQHFFGDPLLWPYIYRANRNVLTDPDSIPASMPLVIPGLRESAKSLHPEDSKMVAEGYMLLYRHYLAKDNATAGNYLYGAKRFDRSVVKRFVNNRYHEKI